MHKILFLIAVLSLIACHKQKEKNIIVEKNDFESLIGWVQVDANKLTKESSHSGIYAAKTDSASPYSIGFIRKLNEISDHQIIQIDMQAYVLSKSFDAQATFVLSIESAGKSVYWQGVNIVDFISAPNKWYPVKCHYDLPKDIPRDSEVRIYIWNKGKEEVLADDFELKFGY
jgi:hypothetical protein